jgi:hypothetical protein
MRTIEINPGRHGVPGHDDRPPGDGPAGRGARGRRRWWLLLVLLAVVALVAGLLLAADDDPVAGPPEPRPAPGTSATTDSTAPPVTTVAEDWSTVVWPFAGTTSRFDDPVDAARGFATEFLGFADPVVGELRRGDSRSGEVDVRPIETGPVTTVLVREMAPGNWAVLGASTDTIELTEPAAGSAIRSPVELRGRALAFEGTVQVEIRQDGEPGPIGEGFVTGGGDVLRPFTGLVGFDPPTEWAGAIVLITHSQENGQAWAATVVRVHLGGGEAPIVCGGYSPPRPAAGPGQMEVTVWFSCDRPGTEGRAARVFRLVPQTDGVLRAALEQLLEGPTATEREAGIRSWFSANTAGMLLGVHVDAGHAVVDLADLRAVIPNASASAGSPSLLRELDSTVFQFRSVESIEYRIDGSCEAFTEWLQLGACEPRTRG